MSSRKHLREIILKGLFQMDLGIQPLESMLEYFLPEFELDEPERDFVSGFLSGIASERAALDALILQHMPNWDMERMASVDRNVLRMGAFELLRRPETPIKVAINEAIELSKLYGTEESGRFVNGILDQIAKNLPSG
jgi:N utilization substance protein B